MRRIITSSNTHFLRSTTSAAVSARHHLSTSTAYRTSWSPGPAPPRLPKEEQEIFEQLQKQSTGAFSTPRSPPKINQSPHAEPEPAPSQQQQMQINQSPHSDVSIAETQEAQAAFAQDDTIQPPKPAVRTGDGEELHPNIRRGAPPEFEGEVNPKTGETGGPKNEPLRWGGEADWSYNGRVTDF